MAIDPKLYEKYSGRSGDPYARLGKALAQSSAHRADVQGRKDRSFSERYVVGGLKARWWMSIIGSVGLLLVVLFSLK